MMVMWQVLTEVSVRFQGTAMRVKAGVVDDYCYYWCLVARSSVAVEVGIQKAVRIGS